MAFKNTLRRGSIRNVIFREGKSWYGAALELNIVESGETPQEALFLLDDAVKGYIEAARKAKLSIGVLNQEINPEYERLWNIGNSKSDRPKAGKREIYSVASQQIAALA
ncbi:MAG: hypothetical protein WDN10_05565 [bacterium]